MSVSAELRWLQAVALAADAVEGVVASGHLAVEFPGPFDEERTEAGRASVQPGCSAQHWVVFAGFRPGSCCLVEGAVAAFAGSGAVEVAAAGHAAALEGLGVADAVGGAGVDAAVAALVAVDVADGPVDVAAAGPVVAAAAGPVAVLAVAEGVVAAAAVPCVAASCVELAVASFLVDSLESPACRPSCIGLVGNSEVLAHTEGRIAAEILPLIEKGTR